MIRLDLLRIIEYWFNNRSFLGETGPIPSFSFCSMWLEPARLGFRSELFESLRFRFIITQTRPVSVQCQLRCFISCLQRVWATFFFLQTDWNQLGLCLMLLYLVRFSVPDLFKPVPFRFNVTGLRVVLAAMAPALIYFLVSTLSNRLC